MPTRTAHPDPTRLDALREQFEHLALPRAQRIGRRRHRQGADRTSAANTLSRRSRRFERRPAPGRGLELDTERSVGCPAARDLINADQPTQSRRAKTASFG